MLLAGPISHTSTQDMDFVKIFNISLVLSHIYYAHFSWCCAFFAYSCHSILECYNLFSGVRLCIRSFCFVTWNNVSYRDTGSYIALNKRVHHEDYFNGLREDFLSARNYSQPCFYKGNQSCKHLQPIC